jgi:hypothetical protein
MGVKKTQLSLTSWPTRVTLNHPSALVTVDSTALTLGPTILCADVITLNCAGGMIVTFVSGLVPPFRIVLTQETCKKASVEIFPGTPDSVTHQINSTGNDPTGTSRDIYIFLLNPRGY